MLVHHLKGGRVESLAFGPDGRTLVVPRPDDGVLIWADVTGGDPPRALPTRFIAPDGSRQFDTPQGRVRVSTDGRRVGCRGWFRGVVYDTTGADLPATFTPDLLGREGDAALTPDGSAVVFAQRPRFEPGPDGITRLSLRPVADPRPAADRWALDLNRWVWDEAALFRDGARFVNPELFLDADPARREPRWVVRDLATGQELAASPPLGRRPTQVAVSPDGRWVAGVHTKHLVAWRADDPGAQPVVRKNDGPLHFTGLAFHPSGTYLATTSNDATVRVYDTTGWEVIRTYAWQVGKLRCIDFSPDALLAAAGGDSGQIVVWDVDL